MKTLENKQTSVLIADKTEPATYADLAMICANVKVDGFTIEEMTARQRLIAALKSADGTIELEDEDAAALRDQVAARRWPLYHDDLIAFGRDVKGL